MDTGQWSALGSRSSRAQMEECRFRRESNLRQTVQVLGGYSERANVQSLQLGIAEMAGAARAGGFLIRFCKPPATKNPSETCPYGLVRCLQSLRTRVLPTLSPKTHFCQP